MPRATDPGDTTMNMKLDGFSFDRGIDRIIHKTHVDETTLPETTQLTPSETITLQELEKLLALPNLGDFLSDMLKPEIENKELLTPQGFQKALESALATLRQSAEGGGFDEETTKLLNKAARVLSEEANLRELLDMYRSVLYQG
jgi:type III secretion protein X